MEKIGILIFTDKIKDRGLSCSCFDKKKYYGLHAIISELDKKLYDIEFCSVDSINKYKYVLISIISYYDALNYINLVRFKKITAKIIIGGPYVLNYNTFRNAFAICIGRGEGLINDIIENKDFDNVIYCDNLKEQYQFRSAKRFLCIGNKNEEAIGCKAKCFFCQYAWKQKYVSVKNNTSYNSSYSNYEDYIMSLNISKNGRYVTAIDGLTERSRFLVNKKITDNDIFEKLNEIKEHDIAGMIKIYNIIGYPWENSVNFNDFLEIVKICDSLNKKRNKNKLTLYLTHTHFIPKLFTPLEDLKINLKNFRDEIIKKPVLFNGNYFKVANNISITSPISAIEEYIVDRADNEDDILLIKKIICSPKYINSNYGLKMVILKKYFKKYLDGYYGIYRIKKTYNLEFLKKHITNKILSLNLNG